ncbi:MAG: AbrB/MazE/SpoVT family DNA-binding domain-containing protein [Clostridia bacterium]|nr:AbrB/MazE/SpoVT family DNA-binding domain-containing protein [Clostridia bacterium]
MLTKIQKWGNSNGVRIPKHMMDQLLMQTNDNVEIEISNGCITVKPVRRRFLSVEERVENYFGKPYEQLVKENFHLDNNDFNADRFEDFTIDSSDGGGMW